MAYILKDAQGLIIASRAEQNAPEASVENQQFVENNTPEYIDFLERSILEADSFRKSGIELARVLEDLISLLIDRNMIRFTDFPRAAQRRLNDRQSMRIKTELSKLADQNQDIMYQVLYSETFARSRPFPSKTCVKCDNRDYVIQLRINIMAQKNTHKYVNLDFKSEG